MKVNHKSLFEILEKLYKDHYLIVYKVIRRKYKYLSHELAEDCLQESFSGFYTKFKNAPDLFEQNFPNEIAFRASWINNAKNVYKNYCSKSENFKAIEEQVKIEKYGELHDIVFGKTSDGEKVTGSSITGLKGDEDRFQKLECIEKVFLKFTQREDRNAAVFFMREYELMTYDNIAETLNKSSGWARNKVYEAKQILRENLLKECEEFVGI